MNLPEGTHLAYIVNHEAWYASVSHRDDPPTVMIQASAQGQGGGAAWEFSIEDGSQRIGRRGLHMQMWDDSWEALAQIPDLFAALATGEVTTLHHLRGLLDSLGADDETSRESPYAPEPPPEPERMACPDVGCQGRAWRMPGGAIFCEAAGGVVPKETLARETGEVLG